MNEAILGVPFDGTAARDTIARSAASIAIVTTLLRIAQRLRDQVLRHRGALALQVEARVALLRTFAATSEGAAYREDADLLRVIERNTARARAARKTTNARRAAAAGGHEPVGVGAGAPVAGGAAAAGATTTHSA